MIYIKKIPHLNPEQIAVCAEALNSGTYNQLSADIRSHLSVCHSCAEELMNVAAMSLETNRIEISDDFISKTNTHTPSKVVPFPKTFLISFAAAAAILFAVFVLNQQWFNQLSQTELVVIEDEADKLEDYPSELAQAAEEQEKDRDKQEQEKPYSDKEKEEMVPQTEQDDIIDKNLLAAFEPNPALEQLYRNMQGNYRGQTIDVKSPSEIDYTKGLKLSWDNPQSLMLYVELFNNQGEEILVKATTDDRFELPALEPGLYYWKLIGAEFDLHFVGKIVHKP